MSRVRITIIETDKGPKTASALYCGFDTTIPYRLFRQRLVSTSRKRSIVIDDALIRDAASLGRADWTTRCGGGRRKTFIYNGDLYPEHRGQYPGFTAFLKTIGRYGDKELLKHRRTAHWDIDELLREPPRIPGQPGYIYKIIETETGHAVYVGLTINPVSVRFAQHQRDAQKGSGAPLHRAIREKGRGYFSCELLETISEGESALRAREIFWIRELQTRVPSGFNVRPGGETGNSRGTPVTWDGRSFPSIEALGRELSKETGLADHVIKRRFYDRLPLPTGARKHSKHPEAGSPHFRQWLGMIKRGHAKGTGVAPEWESYDAWKADVKPCEAGSRRLTRRDESLPWGPNNWAWVEHKKIVERTHGKNISAFGKSWESIAAMCRSFGIPANVYRLRRKSGMSIEESLSKPIGPTSKKLFEWEGEIFASRNKAILAMATRHGISEHKAKDRIVRKIPTAKWIEMSDKPIPSATTSARLAVRVKEAAIDAVHQPKDVKPT